MVKVSTENVNKRETKIMRKNLLNLLDSESQIDKFI